MLAEEIASRIVLFPLTTQIDSQGHLIIGDCNLTDLAEEFGTPLYIFDEFTLRHKCAEFKNEFRRYYQDTMIIYACKAFLNQALALIFKEEGLGLDVVSGGEIAIAQSVAFPMEKVYFHGNNKTREELELALKWGVGRIVVDNFSELGKLNELAKDKGIRQGVLLRVTPGVDAHTHHYTTTGVLDSKFGFPLSAGQAELALTQAQSATNLELLGLHFHLGSPIFSLEPYEQAIELVLSFAAEMAKKYGFRLSEFSPGGGFAIAYTVGDSPPAISDYARAITLKLSSLCQKLGLALPKLIVEPGRGIVGQAGVALYTVGAIKDIPGIRRYVFVDGGMGDNIRPALYGAKYEALVANRVFDERQEKVALAGKFCESGDILVKEVNLPPVKQGDLIAIPSCGAYSVPLSSNYNASLKPAIILVKEGKARLIRQRESYQDLMRLDLV